MSSPSPDRTTSKTSPLDTLTTALVSIFSSSLNHSSADQNKISNQGMELQAKRAFQDNYFLSPTLKSRQDLHEIFFKPQ